MFKFFLYRNHNFRVEAGKLGRFCGLWARIFCAFLPVLAGCRLVPRLPPVDLSAAGWKTYQGQAVWRTERNAPEIAGELLLATNSTGSAFVQFTKTPLPFIVAQSTASAWELHSVPDNKTYSGRGAPPVKALWLWLPVCLAGAPPQGSLSWQRLENNGWRLENRATGEFLEGYLSQ
jgi:hypothetical protein